MHIPTILPLDRTLVAPSAQRVIERLQVGAILEVFSTTREGKRGLIINDQFLPADNNLPLPDGARVKVRVQKNDDKLILKLLPDRTPPPPPEKLEGLMSRLTATPLMKEAVRSLRNALTHIDHPPIETTPKMPSRAQPQEPFVLTPEKLEDVKKVVRLLEQLTLPQLPEKKNGLERQEVRTPLPPSVRLLFITLEENLRSAAQLLPHQQTPSKLPSVQKEVKGAAEEIIKALMRVTKDEIHSESAREVLDIVHQDLKELVKGRGDEKEVRKTLKRAAQTVKNALEEDKAREVSERQSSAEEMLKGQELLSLLNPIAQQAGEPQLLLIPLALNTLVQSGELTVHHPPHDIEEEKKGTKREGEQGTSLLLTLPFPSIGNVQAKVHYTTSQLYLTLTFANDEITRFAEPRLDLLKKRLSELGFPKIEITARSGEVHSAPPTWTRELLRTDIIA